MIRNKKYTRGVTIIELVVYLGLLSVFMVVLLDVFITILNARLETESTSTLDQDTRYILLKLASDIENADSMTLPANLGDSGSSLSVTTGGATDTYSLDGNGNIVLNGAMKLNSNDTTLSYLSFTRIGNAGIGNKPTVKISYTVKSLVVQPSGEKIQTVDTTLGLR